MDIRNTVQNLDILANCTVIEGHLQIVLIDHATGPEYEDKSFPQLREITDYFMMYRVFGLTTLRKLFPNLTVIRGQKLFYNYALVIFEVPQLEELGLIGLTTVARGAIRLEKNRNLCYEQTLDWSKIINMDITKLEDNFIRLNRKDDAECPNFCPAECPVGEDGQGLCWTFQHCQKGNSFELSSGASLFRRCCSA